MYEHLNKDDPAPDSDKLLAVWEDICANKNIIYIVAEYNLQLVAACAMVVVPNLTRGARPYGLIENVVTHSEYRRRGLGSKVLRMALKKAWEQDCYKVMLMTGSKREETLDFYEKAGFQRGVKTGFIAFPK